MRLATDLGRFFVALRSADTRDAPGAGEHNWYRGGSIAIYADDARTAINALGSPAERAAAEAVMSQALDSLGDGWAVWVHGDVARANLLMRDERLAAVIDFGSSAVGDPACDTVPYWTLFRGEARGVFRAAVDLDEATWRRGRGWALWRAVITLANSAADGKDRAAARDTLDVVLDGD